MAKGAARTQGATLMRRRFFPAEEFLPSHEGKSGNPPLFLMMLPTRHVRVPCSGNMDQFCSAPIFFSTRSQSLKAAAAALRVSWSLSVLLAW